MSGRFRLIVWAFAATLLISVAGFVGYVRFSDALYGPAYDASKFVSAEIARYGQAGVFTFTRRIYRPASEGLLPFLGAGRPKNLVDRNYIAAYEIASGGIQILHVEDNLLGPWMPGSGNFTVSHTYGDRVVIRQGGQRRSDGGLEYRDYWLDLDTGELSQLPLRAELADRGYKPAYFYLVDEQGTLVIVGEPLEAASGDGVQPRWLWVRMSNGMYHDVGAFKHYYGVAGEEVHYWSADDRYAAYSLETGRRRSPSRSEYAGISTDPKRDLNLRVDFAVYNNQGRQLHVGRKVGGSWEYKPLALTVQDLAPRP